MKLPKIRSIDVIFVHPKYRSYVIWHSGNFYQLTRMILSVEAWERRTPYLGSLDEIFVTKESCQSGGTDSGAAQKLGLNVVKLPDELHNITANKFLAWWTVNRYGFWHAQDDKDDTKGGIRAAETSHVQAVSTMHSQAIQSQPPSVVEDASSQMPLQTAPPSAPQSDTRPSPSHPSLDKLSGSDIFDALFEDLVDEVEHLK